MATKPIHQFDGYSDPLALRSMCLDCGSLTVFGGTRYPSKCGGCDSTNLRKWPMRPVCGHERCDRPLWNPGAATAEPQILHRCALHEIATYNEKELREWGEDNAADMVMYVRAQLMAEDPHGLVPGWDF